MDKTSLINRAVLSLVVAAIVVGGWGFVVDYTKAPLAIAPENKGNILSQFIVTAHYYPFDRRTPTVPLRITLFEDGSDTIEICRVDLEASKLGGFIIILCPGDTIETILGPRHP